jgi:hypothetical protein
MALNIAKEVAAMRGMTVPDLQRKYAEVFGEESRSRHKVFLIKRIVWRMQANAEGGLSDRARRRAEELANDADLRVQAPRQVTASAAEPRSMATGTISVRNDSRLPMPGTVLARDYRGRAVRVTVLQDGRFEYEGEVYRSLSAIAEMVTGSHWNGYYFFGLKGRKEAV